MSVPEAYERVNTLFPQFDDPEDDESGPLTV